MKTAVKPQTKASQAKAAGAKPAVPPAAPSRRSKITPLTPMRVQAAKSMSKLAGRLQEDNPDLPAHQHLRDAARMLRSGNEEAAQRHLRAAMFSLTPQSLMRNGQHTDDLHIAARAAMHSVHRHLLLVKDITDVAAKNQQAIRRDSYGDDASSPPMPQPPPSNAGYGPGANAQKPTARQPPGNQALNAPNRADGGGPDPAAADPVGKQPAGSKQFTREGHAVGYSWNDVTWNDISAVIDLCAGPPRAVELARPWLPSKQYWGDVSSGHAPPDKGADDEEKADNHIKAAKVASMQGMHAAAAQHLARASALTSDPAKQEKINAVGKGAASLAVKAGQGAAFKLANDYAGLSRPKELAGDYRLSAETGRLAVTPAPRGKPGGPGLYGVKDNAHSPYLENIVKALIRKGMDPGKAYAIAWGSMRRWAGGKGKVHPEVRAAAAGGLALEKVAQARAHAHASTGAAVELVGPGGWSHGWIHSGTGGMAPEDKADRMSKNLSGHSFGDGPDGGEARDANRLAAKAHRQAARLASSPAAVAHHEKMARLHSAVAGGKMYSSNAGKQMANGTWDGLAGAVDLAYNPDQPRGAGGKFGSGGQAAPAAKPAAAKKPLTAQQQQAQQKESAKASATAKATAAATLAKDRQAKKAAAAMNQAQKPPKPDPHQQHVAHMQHLQQEAALRMQEKSAAKEAAGDKTTGGAQTRQGLLSTAANDRKQASALIAQRKVLMAELASAGGATSSGQSGSTTSAGASTTASTAPAVPATTAAATPAATTTTPATPAATTTTPATPAASASATPTAAQLTTAIAGLTTQITSLLKSAAAAQAQAAKMGSAPPAKAPAK